MRAIVFAALIGAPFLLAGCASELSADNFELKATAVGWRAGQDAIFLLRFNPQDADQRSYEIDPVFAFSEIRFEQEGINVFGDYETERAADVGAAILLDGTPVANYTLTPATPQVQVRVHVPETLENGEYRLEVNLFKVGWVKSDVFRVAA